MSKTLTLIMRGAHAAAACAAFALSPASHAHGMAPRSVDAENAMNSAACKDAKLSLWFAQQRNLELEPNPPRTLPAECTGTTDGNMRTAQDATAKETMKTAGAAMQKPVGRD